MKFKVYFIFVLACLILSGCSSNTKDVDNIEPEPTIQNVKYIEYAFTDTLEEDTIAKFKELTRKYQGKQISQITLKLFDTDEISDVLSNDSYKIIQTFSSTCPACYLQCNFLNSFLAKNPDITYIMTLKEKNSSDKSSLDKGNYKYPIYYIDGESPDEFAKASKLGHPSYIILDKDNKIMIITAGVLSSETIEDIFSPLKDVIDTENIDIVGDGNDTGICATCE